MHFANSAADFCYQSKVSALSVKFCNAFLMEVGEHCNNYFYGIAKNKVPVCLMANVVVLQGF